MILPHLLVAFDCIEVCVCCVHSSCRAVPCRGGDLLETAHRGPHGPQAAIPLTPQSILPLPLHVYLPCMHRPIRFAETTVLPNCRRGARFMDSFVLVHSPHGVQNGTAAKVPSVLVVSAAWTEQPCLSDNKTKAGGLSLLFLRFTPSPSTLYSSCQSFYFCQDADVIPRGSAPLFIKHCNCCVCYISKYCT
jgi:hypothetical protein